MGKQTRKFRKPRVNPLGDRVNTGIQQGLTEQQQQQPLSANDVLPVVNKLSSPNANDRIWAVASISQLIMSNSANLKLVYSTGLVSSLIKLLTDENREVVEETLGTLRNISTIDPDVAEEYFAKDILTPLSAMLPEIAGVIDLVLRDAPFADTADQDRRTSIWDVAENFIYIIWSLSEASDKAIKAVNQLNIVSFLISFLTTAEQCPNQVVVAAGQCLTTLTDDNKEIYKEFQSHPEYTQTLLDILNKYQNNNDKILVSVLTCAVLMNLREIVQSAHNIEDLNKIVLPILNASLNFDIQNASNGAIQAVQSGNITKHEEEGTEIAPKPKQPLTKEDILLKTVEDRLTTLQLALELVAGICLQDSTEEDGWEDAGEVMDEDAEEMVNNVNEDNVDDFLREADQLGDNTFNTVDEETVRSNPVLHTFTFEIMPKLIQLATPTPLSFPQGTNNEFTMNITQSLDLTHQRALECINNFLLAMNDIPSKFWFKEQQNDAVQAWRWLFNTANTVGAAPASEERSDILEAIVSCLWALGRGLGQNIPLEPSDVCSLCGAYQAATSESMKVKIVGCLGSIAIRQGDINTNKDIGVFIMQVLTDITNQKTQADVTVEALNLIFDVYSDCAFDYDEPVYVQGKFNQQLKQILPAFKSMVKLTDRRKNFDLRNRCDEALMNLVAFIKYKASERKA